MKSFWSEIKSLNGKKPKLPTKIDQATTPVEICEVWRNKFGNVLNSVDDIESAQELQGRLQNMEETPIHWTTPTEIAEILKNLSSGKAPGTDCVPTDFYKHATNNIIYWLIMYFNAILAHQYVPLIISEVMLSPLIKSSLKDPCSSSSYRPIALSTAASKIIEHIILNRIETYLNSSDHQFGFKKEHGTDICIFALKDTINYYRKLNTPVFLCFVDIKSAFDRVSYNKLFCLLG